MSEACIRLQTGWGGEGLWRRSETKTGKRGEQREESKLCLKGFTQRVSADCLQLPSAPPVVSLATVFPNLSTASLPPLLHSPALPSSIAPPSQTHSIDASPECVAHVSSGPFAQLLDWRRRYSFRVHVSVRFGTSVSRRQPVLQKPECRLFEDTAAPSPRLRGFKDFSVVS